MRITRTNESASTDRGHCPAVRALVPEGGADELACKPDSSAPCPGFENFFRDLTDLTAAGPPASDAIAALADSYGLRFGDAEWLPDLIARYDLTPPPGADRG